jgi:DUF438 domain-containing protein
MPVTPKTRLDELLNEYPFLLDYLVNRSPKFAKLKNPIMRKTVGKTATLEQVAGFGDVPVESLLSGIEAEIARVKGERMDIDLEKAAPLADKKARLEVLKDIIRELHVGAEVEQQKKRFVALIKDISPTEISELEQTLIDEGMPEDEVKRLCDVHVQVFKESLESRPEASSLPGHPLHTLMLENRALEEMLSRVREILDRIEVAWSESASGLFKDFESLLARLAEVEKHYLRKENQLFPLLEARGVSGPSKVMWSIHDDIRAMLKDLGRLLEQKEPGEIATLGRRLVEAMADMIYKEEKILYPMCQETFDETDWARVKKGEEEIGYSWVTPGDEWQPSVRLEDLPPVTVTREKVPAFELDTGALTLDQVNLLLKNLPIDVTYVDETDTVRYYSAGAERLFPRTPAVIGRRVQNCHPPESVGIVNRILDSFRRGERRVAEFWISLKGRFIHIRYFAVRDSAGAYRGCLEISQDVSAIRELGGEKRLLDW